MKSPWPLSRLNQGVGKGSRNDFVLMKTILYKYALDSCEIALRQALFQKLIGNPAQCRIAVTNLGHVEGPKNSSAPFPDRLESDHRPLFGLSSTAQSPVLTINMDVLVATDFVTTEVWTWGGLVTYPGFFIKQGKLPPSL